MISKKQIIIEVTEAENKEELPLADQELVTAAQTAAARAYSPYSHFQVGAALRLSDGTIIEGNNQENAAYPSGLCAERVACFYANSRYPDLAVESIAICASNKNGFLPSPIPPCGNCRQALLETEERFGRNIRIILYGTQKIKIINSIKELLPIHFDSNDLE